MVSKSAEELRKASYQYHYDEDKKYVEYLKKIREARENDGPLGEIILDFLIEWGGPSTARWFPIAHRERLKEGLNKWCQSHKSQLGNLIRFSLFNVDISSIKEELVDLFGKLMNLQQSPEDPKRRSFGVTAAGKTLHLLLPELCPIWDNAGVREPLGLRGTAQDYLKYLAALQKFLKDHVSPSESDSIAKTHIVNGNGDHIVPILKILDEAIYASSSFRDQYILPLLTKASDGK